MNGFIKGLVLMAVLMYVISPVDLVPGPIDDIIVLALGLAYRKQITG